MTENPLVDTHVHVFTTDMPLIDNPRHTPTYSYTCLLYTSPSPRDS